ncbi:hypothetical protein LCGC14_1721060 [marine sediment metagenome]|uniref:Uncharacterized protein n=1 Tax=marine sediment metagenome TaxID=412755 RepID=A0A0F9HCG4_9ZZZZ
MRISKKERERREALLIDQGNICALCHNSIPTAFRMLLVEKQNAIICRACSMFMSVYARNESRGVTPEVLAVFLARDAASEPITHKKLSLEQIKGRYHVAAGQVGNMTLADYDARVGSSGSVIVPDGKPLLVDEVMEHTGECTGE